MNEIINEKIENLLKNGRAVIAVDGMCASGKSTLADEIQGTFGGTVIRADSFFLPFDMRSEERLGEPGGNFHYERFYDEIIKNLSSSQPFSYGVFDCESGKISNCVTVDEKRLVIIEGSYCMHPILKAEYDLKVFCKTDNKTQLERILKRNGKRMLKMFEAKWIPFENKYFSTYNIQKLCDVTVVT